VVTLPCRIKITGLLPEDVEFSPIVSTSSSTPDLTKKAGNAEGVCILLCSRVTLIKCRYFILVQISQHVTVDRTVFKSQLLVTKNMQKQLCLVHDI